MLSAWTVAKIAENDVAMISFGQTAFFQLCEFLEWGFFCCGIEKIGSIIVGYLVFVTWLLLLFACSKLRQFQILASKIASLRKYTNPTSKFSHIYKKL